MSAAQEPDVATSDDSPHGSGGFVVDARGATAVQTGEGNTQIIYTYNSAGTWTDGVASPPLVDVSGSIASPYRGLAAYEERDAALFFGRETAATELLARLARRLRRPGLMMVSGVSGAGKSSLLRAGVLPRIRGAGLASEAGSASWPCLVLTPGRAPIDQLAIRIAAAAGVDAASVRRELADDPTRLSLVAAQAALARTHFAVGDDPERSRAGQRRLLLVVDQFEQLFTQCPDEGQRAAFITALHAAAAAVHGRAPAALVVLVVRADFEARCADYHQLTAAVQDRFLVTAMNPRQLRMAITEPAKKAGGRVEDDLVQLLHEELQTRAPASEAASGRSVPLVGAGVLPLLSHALDQAWRTRTTDVLTVADYERIGGIEGAVGESAERAYARLTSSQRAVARQVFSRLIATSSDGIDAADRVNRAELTQGAGEAERADVQHVLESFAAERLLILGADTVEISHEVLLSSWPLLRDTWLAENHVDRITRSRLRATAAEWSSRDHDPSYLYSGSLLEAANRAASRIDLDPTRHPRLSQVEQEFLHASGRARRRRLYRWRGYAALLMVMILGLAAVAVVAYRSSQDAVQERDVAVAGQLISQSEAEDDVHPEQARVDSLAAWGIDPSAQARYAMLSSARLPWISTFVGDSAPLSDAMLSPNGKLLVTAGVFSVQLWDVATGRQIGTSITDHGGVFGVALSRNGKTLAICVHDTLQLWDVVTHRRIGSPLTGRVGGPTVVAFSPNGRTLATGNETGATRVWDVATGKQIGNSFSVPAVPMPGSDFPVPPDVGAVTFSPNGKILAVSYIDGTVRLWNVTTGSRMGSALAAGASGWSSVAFSPDGKILATAGDSSVRLWNVSTGQQITGSLGASTSPATAVAFSPDGRTLATGHADGTARLWEVATRQQIGAPMTGHTGHIASVAFSANGKALVTAGDDGTARLWDLRIGQQTSKLLTGKTGVVAYTDFSPNGKIFATAGFDTTQLWDVATGRPIGARIAGDAFSFSPNSRILAAVDIGGKVRLWNATNGHEIVQLATGHTHQVDVVFRPDGKAVETASADGTVRLWDVGSGRPMKTLLSGHAGTLDQVGLLRGGTKLIIVNSDDTSVRLWNLTTGHQTADLIGAHAHQVYSMAVSPDGNHLATGNDDGTVRMLDLTSDRQIGQPFTGHTGSIQHVTFSPDGTILATASDDGTVRLWDVATGRQIGSGLAVPGYVDSIAFSPDGKTLVTAGTDGPPVNLDDHTAGSVRLWNVGYLVDVSRQLCARVGGSLTPSEWAHHVPPGPTYRKVCP